MNERCRVTEETNSYYNWLDEDLDDDNGADDLDEEDC